MSKVKSYKRVSKHIYKTGNNTYRTRVTKNGHLYSMTTKKLSEARDYRNIILNMNNSEIH